MFHVDRSILSEETGPYRPSRSPILSPRVIVAVSSEQGVWQRPGVSWAFLGWRGRAGMLAPGLKTETGAGVGVHISLQHMVPGKGCEKAKDGSQADPGGNG